VGKSIYRCKLALGLFIGGLHLDNRKELLIVNGEDKTDSVVSFSHSGKRCGIKYKGSQTFYSYNVSSVQRLKLIRTVDPDSVIIRKDGRLITGISALYDFGTWVRIERGEWKAHCYPRNQLTIEQNSLASQAAKDMMEYFRTVADAISLKTDDDVRILSRQYERISQISAETVLAKYIGQQQPDKNTSSPEQLIFRLA